MNDKKYKKYTNTIPSIYVNTKINVNNFSPEHHPFWHGFKISTIQKKVKKNVYVVF